MDKKNITLTPEAISAIEGLQHTCGTFQFYIDTLSRLYNFILDQGDEIGMDDIETLHALRVLHHLKIDLACIAGHTRIQPEEDIEDTAGRVETTFAELDFTNDDGDADNADEE